VQALPGRGYAPAVGVNGDVDCRAAGGNVHHCLGVCLLHCLRLLAEALARASVPAAATCQGRNGAALKGLSAHGLQDALVGGCAQNRVLASSSGKRFWLRLPHALGDVRGVCKESSDQGKGVCQGRLHARLDGCQGVLEDERVQVVLRLVDLARESQGLWDVLKRDGDEHGGV
jgi:hypothetical protein